MGMVSASAHHLSNERQKVMTDKAIVVDALRRMILDVDVYTHDRSAALDELVSIKMQEAREESRVTTSDLWLNNMNAFRTHRAQNHRIATIKEVRKVFNCGLMEALIIVKGIESHDNILSTKCPAIER